eukprot:CAMPEP_0185850006 /NCGR_PEP_ID=MMETSP1354-20130828/4303_1 /TAXON_ID=708628 /ORGANISM="Erythrolobus madagascarensis, Strain CCMP3276" /LENGTH=118 /DNA_ID=CAMNT_0028550625 /DNA_START=305 /DNA_END=661 /DNA_ORIENTATION=+
MWVRHIADIPKKQLSRDLRNMVLAYLFPMFFQSVYYADAGATKISASTSIILLTAAFLYANHIPEKYAPGAFDLIGCSHNIMHALAFAAHASEWAFLHHMAFRSPQATAAAFFNQSTT